MDTDTPTITFPVIRGIQANQVYYVAMWTYGMMQRVTIFDDSELESFDRIQRNLNSKRIPEIKEYILNNRDTYVFSALTASIDKNVVFEPITPGSGVGQLKVSLNSKFVINDGQHRRKAILEAMAEDPSLATETIAVVFFVPGASEALFGSAVFLTSLLGIDTRQIGEGYVNFHFWQSGGG